MKLLIKGARVVDPANNLDEACDILIQDSKILRVGKNIKNGADKTIDAEGKIALPGLVDMHVHLREPGREDKETIATGSLAALKGGVTTLLAMPNTHPAIDSVESVRLLKNLIKKAGKINILIAACITKGREGKEVTDIIKLRKEGAVAVSDDGASVDNADLLKKALKIADKKILPLLHCEDKTLSNGGAVNLGYTSTRMGLKGISKESEYLRVERDIGLAAQAKAPVHITHVSCKESLEIIARAKKKGLRVTCDVTPHHFSLNEEMVAGYDTNMKMNPPLRSRDDTEAIKKGLKNGLIDAIASDHAPHTENEKYIEFDRAEFGVIGLETELSAAITELVAGGILDWSGLARKMSLNPAKILGIDKGTLTPGAEADIIVVSPEESWLVEKQCLVSKSKNSAFLGRKLKGLVDYTICNGKILYQR